MRKLLIAAMACASISAGAYNLHWVDKDVHHPIDNPHPTLLPDTLCIEAWRGETIAAEAMLIDGAGETLRLSLPGGTASQMRYVLTDNQRACGQHNFNLAPWLVADIIDRPSEVILEAGTVRPIWCSINIPADATPGIHDYTLTAGDRELTLRVNVSELLLPPPSQWQFHLDFWQQPYAVSRYYGLERWSPEHFEALKPYMRQLTRAGQKVVTTILFYEPWGDQSHDKFDPMVQTTLRPDGSWAYDYHIFDQYVEMMDSCGISEQINCYSMVPWDMSFRYFDEAAGEFKTLETKTSTPEYRNLWGSFIRSFAAHLREKGWFDKTCIAMDERGLEAMTDAHALVHNIEPDFKMALAGYRHESLATDLYDYCIPYGQHFTAEELQQRKAKGLVTTTYTCCVEAEPNILSNNNPADGAYLPLNAVANGFDGYLHWSWLNWPDNPLSDSRFRLFSAGDTYLFYPGPRSSVRFERMIEGIQMAEKIRLLREHGADMTQIDAALASIAAGKVSHTHTSAQQVEAVRQAIQQASR